MDWIESTNIEMARQDKEGEWIEYDEPFFEYNNYWGIPEGAD